MKINIISAISNNNVIGHQNTIPWKVPADLEYFKQKTLGHYVIMGRKTYESIKHPLPLRTNIVISRTKDIEIPKEIVKVKSFENAISYCKSNESEGDAKDIFIIGGRSIYELALPIADMLFITEIDCNVDGDVFFPKFDMHDWKEISYDCHNADDKNEYNYNFKVLKR